MSGFVVWFTGLSGAGKSTLGAMLAAELRLRGKHVEVLDGDEVRTHLSKGLGFSREDRDTNIRRIGFVAKLVARSGGIAITAAISPFRSIRDEQRAAIGRFVEVYCCASIDALAARDPKGLYRKALAGEIKGFTGIDDPYEPPNSPEVTVLTDRESRDECVARILAKLEELGYVETGRLGSGSGSRQLGDSAGSSAGSSPPEAAGVGASNLLKTATRLGTDLVRPYGGELISRRASDDDRDPRSDTETSLPIIDLDAPTEAMLTHLASGALSPLKGFLGSKDYLRVLRDMRLENGIPWPIPVTLPASEECARQLAKSNKAALRARNRRIVAILNVGDIFCPRALLQEQNDTGLLKKFPVDANRPQHVPGTLFVGGEILELGQQISHVAPYSLVPSEVRAHLQSYGYKNTTFLRNTGTPSRAFEHYARLALEVSGSLLLQVAVEDLQGNGNLLKQQLDAHKVLVESYFDPERIVISAGAAFGFRGVRSAILDAIIGQNFGADRVALAGTSYSCCTDDIEAAFRNFGRGEIITEPLYLEKAFYSPLVGGFVSVRTAPRGAQMLALDDGNALRPDVAAALETMR